MFLLDNAIRRYAWGSREVIATLTGREHPTPEPEAEMWLGAHPSAPSRAVGVDGEPGLDALIEADPVHHLGHALTAEYQARLPFLFKVLAADAPLSLQAHPNRAQAKAGFEREEDLGVSRVDPKRNYHDSYAKPELLVALSDCEVLCGFRDAREASDILARLGIRILSPYVASLLTGNPADGLRVAVTTLLAMPKDKQCELVQRVVEESARLVARLDQHDPDRASYQWAVRLGEKYPSDIGVVLSLLMNLHHLRPMQGLFLGAGQMHAYLRGWGLEAQANSDNTLRVGLTKKHVDIAELLRILEFEPTPSAVIDPVVLGEEAGPDAGMTTWRTGARDFEVGMRVLDHIDHTKVPLVADGPQIVLVLDGALRVECLSDEGPQRIDLTKGQSVYLSAHDNDATIAGCGKFARIRAGQVPRGHA